ncbi:hypothetical protein L226DRAFT_576944 [Lentinus tigrinus ALCF2SS1-7]|uniref:uncharacterized protein n=1 Tax=Lentinus tigrinus ALCF2SS1-7 TaxID=1328758 RepID=UPI001166034C|nr:hypothetical protein L226DRAFT_576944 [Lentinus tigrinus ALCF2SS1-7]
MFNIPSVHWWSARLTLIGCRKGKVVFDIKDTMVKGTYFTGIASVKIVECTPSTSVLLIIPPADTQAPEAEETMYVDIIDIDPKTELKPDLRARSVEISEYPREDQPDLAPTFTVTVLLPRSIIFWAFMEAYSKAMLKYHEHLFAVEGIVNAIINEADDDDMDDDENKEEEAQPEPELGVGGE